MLGLGAVSASGGQPDVAQTRLQFGDVTVTARLQDVSATLRGQTIWSRPALGLPWLTQGSGDLLIITGFEWPPKVEQRYDAALVSAVLNPRTGDVLATVLGVPVDVGVNQGKALGALRFADLSQDRLTVTDLSVATLGPRVRILNLATLLPTACRGRDAPSSDRIQAGVLATTMTTTSVEVDSVVGHCDYAFSVDFDSLQVRFSRPARLTSPPPTRRPGR